MHACLFGSHFFTAKEHKLPAKRVCKARHFLTRLKPPRAVKWKIAKVSSSDEDGGAVGRNGFIANAHIIIKCIAVERENYTFPARGRRVRIGGRGARTGKDKTPRAEMW